jgi:hypothetical protein
MFGGAAFAAFSPDRAIGVTNRRVFVVYLPTTDQPRFDVYQRQAVRVIDYRSGNRWLTLWLSFGGYQSEFHVIKSRSAEADALVAAIGGRPRSPMPDQVV